MKHLLVVAAAAADGNILYDDDDDGIGNHTHTHLHSHSYTLSTTIRTHLRLCVYIWNIAYGEYAQRKRENGVNFRGDLTHLYDFYVSHNLLKYIKLYDAIASPHRIITFECGVTYAHIFALKRNDLKDFSVLAFLLVALYRYLTYILFFK